MLGRMRPRSLVQQLPGVAYHPKYFHFIPGMDTALGRQKSAFFKVKMPKKPQLAQHFEALFIYERDFIPLSASLTEIVALRAEVYLLV